MPTVEMEIPTREEYERIAQEYMASLPLEHYMEGNPSFMQRWITVTSLRFLQTRRSDFQIGNELLVLYPLPNRKTGRVVPDNMIVLQEEPIGAVLSFNTPYQPARPFMVMEYVSSGNENQRKDYVLNRRLYERELKVPYYMIFDPVEKVLSVFQLKEEGRYVELKQNENGRIPIAELDLELDIVEGWVRYWYRNELLPIEAEAQEKMDRQAEEINALTASVEEERKEKLFEQQRAEWATRRAEEEKRQRELERQRAEEALRFAEEAKRQNESERQRAEEALRFAEEAKRQNESERQRAEKALQRLAELEEKMRNHGIEPGL